MHLIKRTVWFVLALASIILLPLPTAAAEPCRQIFVTNHGYHTGIVVPLRDFDPQRTLSTAYFNNRNWIEIGWGDAAFYQARGEDYWHGLKALLTPTEAILHVHAFLAPPKARFSASEVIGVKVSEAGYRRLLARIKATFTRNKDGRVIPAGNGLYGVSYFYKAEGSYSLTYTCNSWTAEMLADAGVDIDPGASKRASSVMDRLKEVGLESCGPGASNARP